MQRRHLLMCAFTALPLSAWASPASDALPIGILINRAGRLRALSQRLSKAYVQAQLNVLPLRASEIQTQCRHSIAQSIETLQRQPGNASTKLAMTAVIAHADKLIGLTSSPHHTNRPVDVLQVADLMLSAADELTQAFEKMADQALARVVNMAGRQRMLSQRAARAYFMKASDSQRAQSHQQQLMAARDAFNAGLSYLTKAPLSTPAIQQQLALAQGQWLFFDQALRQSANTQSLQTVATTSERMFEVMDELTSLYDTAVRDLFK